MLWMNTISTVQEEKILEGVQNYEVTQLVSMFYKMDYLPWATLLLVYNVDQEQTKLSLRRHL